MVKNKGNLENNKNTALYLIFSVRTGARQRSSGENDYDSSQKTRTVFPVLSCFRPEVRTVPCLAPDLRNLWIITVDSRNQ